MNLEIRIAEKTAALQGSPQIICGNSDYTLTFFFDSEWDAYPVKTARFVYFQNGIAVHQDVLFEGDTVTVPVLHGVYEVAVGVYAGDIHTTTPARISCVPSITCGSSPHDAPSQDVYDQLMEYLASIRNGNFVDAQRLAAVCTGKTVISIAQQEE